MPTYQYQCKQCGHTLEELQSMTEPPLVTCPKCGTDNLAKVMGTGSGLIFKGSGFYLTDYRKGNVSPTSPKPPTTETKNDPPAKESKPTPPAKE
jgi:putative FmdB family regulatory protein